MNWLCNPHYSISTLFLDIFEIICIWRKIGFFMLNLSFFLLLFMLESAKVHPTYIFMLNMVFFFDVSFYLGVLFDVMLLGPDPTGHQFVFDRVGQGTVVVPGRGHIPVLDQGVMKVTIKVLLDLVDVVQTSNAADTDLFLLLPLIGVHRIFRHGLCFIIFLRKIDFYPLFSLFFLKFLSILALDVKFATLRFKSCATTKIFYYRTLLRWFTKFLVYFCIYAFISAECNSFQTRDKRTIIFLLQKNRNK